MKASIIAWSTDSASSHKLGICVCIRNPEASTAPIFNPRAHPLRDTDTTPQARTNAGRSKQYPGCCRARAWDDEDRPLIKKALKRKGRAGNGPYESTSLYTYIPDLFLFLFYFLMKEYYPFFLKNWTKQLGALWAIGSFRKTFLLKIFKHSELMNILFLDFF